MDASTDPVALMLSLTPAGHLVCVSQAEAPLLPAAVARDGTKAFASGAGSGLLYLGASQVATALPPIWAWWRDFAARYLTTLCTTPEGSPVPPPDKETLEAWLVNAPPMLGGEHLDVDRLRLFWTAIGLALEGEAAPGESSQTYLRTRHAHWNRVGRVYFNLAENRKDKEAPFAFLVTYTTRLSAHGTEQHLPLAQALTEFSGANGKAQMLSLLAPVQQAADACPWVAAMVASGEIYHPLRWQIKDAARFLADLPRIETAGIVVRMPAQWASGRPARPKVSATVGTGVPSGLGLDSLLDFDMTVTLDGEPLSAEEIRSMLSGGDGLQWLRGKWVEVNHERLAGLIDRFHQIQSDNHDGLALADAMRLLSGTALDGSAPDPNWSEVVAGGWLADTLRHLRSPAGLARVDPGPSLTTTLRPYQREGLRWLWLLVHLGLGACLADDMGLGKTIQVLALLLALKREGARTSLLIVPASLLANWVEEAKRFAPGLRCLVAHPSGMTREALQTLDTKRLRDFDLVLTTYATLPRLPNLLQMHWRLAVLDEAQAIKNPSAKQTKQVKQLKADARIALTGTPVENRLSDLWSIFDFTHPGLLGSARVFAGFAKRLAGSGQYAPLRGLVAPYILRRLKTDKRVITDLPDKTELTAWCAFAPLQAALYQKAVEALSRSLQTAEGMERRGLVLAYLMRFKQICNHPSQWLADGGWKPADSGKFIRLREIAETIAAKQEKLLVFTQFRETTAPLAAFLGNVFGRAGLVLHGGIALAKRRDLVQRFQDDERTPFFVLSLKIGGSGLNLTAASHVVHFDRWWNPAVEAQSTDRAFRIGQHRNVLVHKFVCRGTIEERIDGLIRTKQQLVHDVVEGTGEINLTEMSNDELLDLVKLDIHSVGD